MNMKYARIHRPIGESTRRAWATAVAGIAALACSPVSAAETDEAAPGLQLEEIIVTAQKRSERLQDIPISVQVVSGQTLAEQNLNSLVDVAQTAPSVRIESSGRNTFLFIRGVGSGGSQSFDQSVGLFIDDIYHGRSRVSSGAFLDLERIEILKGPQTTFFGNNAIAGAFSLVTRKPGDGFDAQARALYGEQGQYALEGAVDVPFTDTFGMRAVALASGFRGWLKNVNTDDHLPDEKNRVGRVTLQFTPSDAFDATLKVEGSKNDSDGLAKQIYDCPPPAIPASGACAAALAQGLPVGLDQDSNSENGGQDNDIDTTDAALTVNFHQWGHTFTAVTGYYDYRYNLNLDGDYLPFMQLNIGAPERYHQISQEFRIASPADQPLEYLAGLYYQRGDLFFRQDIIPYFLSPFLVGTPFEPFLPLGQSTAFEQREDSYSVFGAVTWHITDRLDVGAGLRGSRVDKEYIRNISYGTATQDYGGLTPVPDVFQPFVGAVFGTPAGVNRGDRSDDAWMPSAKIQYRLNPDAMVYASYARGFKAGGFNGADVSGVAENLPFDSEHVDAYEIGLKSEWFDRRVLVNVAVFQSDYKDLQVATDEVRTDGTILNLVTNAAESRSKGVELETQWVALEDLRLSVNLTYLDSSYVRYDGAPLSGLQTFCRGNPGDAYCVGRYPGGVGPTQDLSGQRAGYAPRWSGSLTGHYSPELPGGYRLVTELNAYFASDMNRDPLDTHWIDGYVRLDGRLSLESPGARWAVDLLGKNLNDRIIKAGFSKQQRRNFALQVRFDW